MTDVTMGLAALPTGQPDHSDGEAAGDALTVDDLARMAWPTWDAEREMDGDDDEEEDERARISRLVTRKAGLSIPALVAYVENVGDEAAPVSQHVSDLLVDLYHLCDATGLDFEGMIENVSAVHHDEIHGRWLS